jgi:pyrrolidone-carboxylate peptidase
MTKNNSSKMIVTGFGPFNDTVDNPSARLCCQLNQDAEVLKVTYAGVKKFVSEFSSRDYESILCLGVNTQISEPRFEVYGHNHIGSGPDANGRVPASRLIAIGAPRVLGQTLAGPNQMKLPIKKSYTPGDYLCNFLLYSLLLVCPNKSVGFVHVPTFDLMPEKKQLKKLSELLNFLEILPQPPKSLL